MKRPVVIAVVIFVAAIAWIAIPRTAAQSGKLHLMAKGRVVAQGVLQYKAKTGDWPPDLGAVVDAGELSEESLRYPNITELPDRREILKKSDHVEWLYIRPRDKGENFPLIVAPLAFTKAKYSVTWEPKRILIDRNGRPSIVDEADFATTLQQVLGAEQDAGDQAPAAVD